MNGPPVIAHALNWAKLGYAVFPQRLTQDDASGKWRKKPALNNQSAAKCLGREVLDGKGGHHTATCAEAEVTALFGAHDGINGIGCNLKASGLIAIDDDSGGNSSWIKRYEDKLNATRVHQTPSGGRHYIFRVDDQASGYVTSVDDLVEVKYNASITLPGSAAPYEVINDIDPITLPEELRQELKAHEGETNLDHVTDGDTDRERKALSEGRLIRLLECKRNTLGYEDWFKLVRAISFEFSGTSRSQQAYSALCNFSTRWENGEAGEEDLRKVEQIWKETPPRSGQKPVKAGTAHMILNKLPDRTEADADYDLDAEWFSSTSLLFPTPLGVQLATGEPEEKSVEIVDIFNTLPVPRLNQDMVPDVLWRFGLANAEQIGVAMEALVMPAIWACGVAISDDVKIQPRSKAPWKEAPRTWMVVIGDPSTKKSPALAAATKPLEQVEREKCAATLDKLKAYEKELAIWKKKDGLHTTWQAGGRKEKVSEPGPEPEKPRSDRYLTTDATPEALVRITSQQTRGIGIYRDEIGGWLGSMDAYNGAKTSKDRPFYLQAYNGGSYISDRADASAGARSSNVGCSVIGTAQPDAPFMSTLLSTRDGMIARFIPVLLASGDGAVGANVPASQHDNEAYERLIRTLVELQSVQVIENDGKVEVVDRGPIVVPDEISAKIDEALREINLLAKADGTIPPAMAEHIGKFEGLAYRLLLIFHCIQHPHDPWDNAISEGTADMALRLVRGYILQSAYYLYSVLGASTRNSSAQSVAIVIAEWILSKGVSRFTLRDVARDNRTKFPSADKDGNALRYMALNLLEDAGWIMPIDMERHTIFEPHKRWAVHPELHEIMRDIAEQKKQERKRGLELLQRNIAKQID